MDEAQIAKDAAIAFFYFVGAITVIVGGTLAARRFFFERPYEPLWEHAVQECRVRRIQAGDDEGSFVYIVITEIKNRSKSWQDVTRIWTKTVLPDEEDGVSVDLTQMKTPGDAQAFFGDAPQPQMPDEIGPDEAFSFGQGVVSKTGPEHVVRVLYAFEFRRKRVFWPGYKASSLLAKGALNVPVSLDDLKFYEMERQPS